MIHDTTLTHSQGRDLLHWASPQKVGGGAFFGHASHPTESKTTS